MRGLIPLTSRYLWKASCKFSSKSLRRRETTQNRALESSFTSHQKMQKYNISRIQNSREVGSFISELILRDFGIFDREALNHNLLRVSGTTKLHSGPTFLGDSNKQWETRLVALLLIIVISISFLTSNKVRHVNFDAYGFTLIFSRQFYSLQPRYILNLKWEALWNFLSL